jgi:hypothetical protein
MPKARWIAGATTLACGAILAVFLGSRLSAKEQDGGGVRPGNAAARPGAGANAEPGADGEAEFPVVEGRYPLTSEWSIQLPGRFKRRVDDSDMYLWRPGLTLVIAIWNNSESDAGAQLSALKSDISHDAYDLTEEAQGELKRLAYRLHEAAEDQRQDAFYAFVVAPTSYVQLAVYFDDAQDVEAARQVWRSLAPTPSTDR